MAKASYNVVVYILVQSEKNFSLIWKAKPVTIQMVNGKKINQKGKKFQNNGLL